MSPVGQVVSAFGSGPVAVLAWETRGFDDIVLYIDERTVPTDPTVAALAAAHRRRMAATPGAFNELRFSPRTLHQRRVGLRESCVMNGVMTDYAAWLAAKQQWENLSDTQRVARCRSGLLGLEAHGIGVAACVVCSDGQVLLGLRPPGGNWYPSHWSTVAESAQIGDVSMSPEGVPEWRPQTTAQRGLEEEIGVSSARIGWKFFAVVVDVVTGSLSVLGRAEVPFSSERVLELWQTAPDANEAAATGQISWELSALETIEKTHYPMVPVDALTVAGAAALDLGWDLCVERGWVATL